MKTHLPRILALGAALALATCATTAQTRSAKPAGFLGDYTGLEPGTGDQAQLVYVNPRAQWRSYSSVFLGPVTIWRSEGSEIEDVPDDELKQLADRFETVLRQELQTDWALAERPGPGVMRLRVALTEAKGAPMVMNVISSILPQMRLISAIKKVSTGTNAFVGRASVEAELRDGLTDERLMAAVDERAGTHALRDGVGTWSDVDQALRVLGEAAERPAAVSYGPAADPT